MDDSLRNPAPPSSTAVPCGAGVGHSHPPNSMSDPAVSALDRTLRIMRDDLRADVPDTLLRAALAGPRVLLIADAENLVSPAAQTAVVTTSLLLMRAGTSVVLQAPDVLIHGVQAPLIGTRLVTALVEVGRDLVPGVSCYPVTHGVDAFASDGDPRAGKRSGVASGNPVDARADEPRVAILFGDTAWHGIADLVIRLSGDAVSGRMSVATAPRTVVTANDAPELFAPMLSAAPDPYERWAPTLGVPFGALVAAGLAAGEVYKLAMRSLATWARTPKLFAELFGVSEHVIVSVDPEREVAHDALDAFADVGAVDAISGGAIIQATLFALARIPGITGRIRVIEPETADHTNLNRYALLRRCDVGLQKAEALSALALGNLDVRPVVARYDRSTPMRIGGLADAVLVGVDHIPTRWAAQKARPTWLGIGATSHYSAMSSDHARETACAWCLHPTDAPDLGPIPTVAFVSHWAGVLLAWRLVRYRLGFAVSATTQYDYLTPLRGDLAGSMWRAPVAARPGCPNGCLATRRVA